MIFVFSSLSAFSGVYDCGRLIEEICLFIKAFEQTAQVGISSSKIRVLEYISGKM